MHNALAFRRSWLCILAALILVRQRTPGGRPGIHQPLYGYNFGGDAGCPQITDCEDKHANYGVGIRRARRRRRFRGPSLPTPTISSALRRTNRRAC